jgi:hypothetical protein
VRDPLPADATEAHAAAGGAGPPVAGMIPGMRTDTAPAPPVLVERDGAIQIITLNRPEARNAVNH